MIHPRSEHQTQSSSISSSTIWMIWQSVLSAILQAVLSSYVWYARGLHCHPGRPQKAPQQESHEVHQGKKPISAPEEEQPHSLVYPRVQPAGKKLCRKGLGDLVETRFNRSQNAPFLQRRQMVSYAA